MSAADLEKHREVFALRLCDLDTPGSERAFRALVEGRKVYAPSDRVKAAFAVYCQDEHLSWRETDLLREAFFA